MTISVEDNVLPFHPDSKFFQSVTSCNELEPCVWDVTLECGHGAVLRGESEPAKVLCFACKVETEGFPEGFVS